MSQADYTALFPVLLQRPGGHREVFWAARCAKCGDLILDLSLANVTLYAPLDEPDVVGEHEGARVSLLGNAYLIHKDCDYSPSGTPWIDAGRVLHHDQRGEWEK